MTTKEGQIADWDTFIDRFITEEITKDTPNPPKANFYKRAMVYMTQLSIHSSEPHQKGIIQFMRWIEKRKSTTKRMAPLKSKIYSSGYEWKVSLIPASFLPHCSLPQQQSFTNVDTNFRFHNYVAWLLLQMETKRCAWIEPHGRFALNVGDTEKPVPTPEISTINERRNIIEKNDLHGVLKVKNEMVLY